MDILLKRDTYTQNSTIGKIFVNGLFQCDCLEDRVRAPGVKVHGKTAIPAGRYQVRVTQSARFNRLLPLLLNVPNYEGVRIHPGNKPENTEGCLLPGLRTDQPDWVKDSKDSFNDLFDEITDAVANGQEIFITIEDTMNPEDV